ncbi:MAG TPA: hypothetical protein VG291_15590 [Xanthobacteraceae bacterium]|nr:hypothetical protein [Xanthobacteraceae bacterium]
MRIDTIQPKAIPGAATDSRPERVFATRARRRISIAATILATTTAVLLASGLAIVMNLS